MGLANSAVGESADPSDSATDDATPALVGVARFCAAPRIWTWRRPRRARRCGAPQGVSSPGAKAESMAYGARGKKSSLLREGVADVSLLPVLC